MTPNLAVGASPRAAADVHGPNPAAAAEAPEDSTALLMDLEEHRGRVVRALKDLAKDRAGRPDPLGQALLDALLRLTARAAAERCRRAGAGVRCCVPALLLPPPPTPATGSPAAAAVAVLPASLVPWTGFEAHETFCSSPTPHQPSCPLIDWLCRQLDAARLEAAASQRARQMAQTEARELAERLETSEARRLRLEGRLEILGQRLEDQGQEAAAKIQARRSPPPVSLRRRQNTRCVCERF